MNKKILLFVIVVAVAGGAWYWQNREGAYEPVGVSPTPSADASVSPSPTPTPMPVASRTPSKTATPTPKQNPIMKEVNIVEVVIRGSAFEPVALTVHQGDIVQFSNLDSAVHVVKSDNAVIYSGTIAPNSAWSLMTANIPKGVYEYFCTVHPSMRATLTIN